MARSRTFLRWGPTPEVLFLTGGEEQSPVYPLPDSPAFYQLGYIATYDRGAAAVEQMQLKGYAASIAIAGNLALRDVFVADITKAIPRAADIERQRQALANVLNHIYRPLFID